MINRTLTRTKVGFYFSDKYGFFESPSGFWAILSLVLFASANAQSQSCNPDLTTPSITCAEPDTFFVASGECSINNSVALTLPLYSDNCAAASSLIISNTLPEPPYSVGVTAFYWTVKDVEGNSGACATKIVVIDPTFTCPEISGGSLAE